MSSTLSDQWQHKSPTPTSARVRYHPRQFSADFHDTPTAFHTAADSFLQRGYPEQDDSGQPPPCIFPPPPCQGPDCAATPLPPCIPFSSHHPPTGTPTFTTSSSYPSQSYSTTGGTSAIPSTSDSSPSVAVPTGTSAPATGPPALDPAHPLTTVQIAGIALGGVLGLLFLGIFVWLLRRGTFGSGTLCGFRYGDARRAGWRPDLGDGNVRAEMSQAGKGMGSAGNLVSPFADPPSSHSLPSYPSSTLTASSSSLPFVPDAKLRGTPPLPPPLFQAPLPRSPAAWSTSPSAFDNAYGSIVAGCPSTACSSPSRSRSTPSDALSDVSTLVSGRVRTPRSTRTPSSLIPRPGSVPAQAVEVESDMSAAATATVTRTPSPAPSSGAASTIEGVRISSWHPSDSEETGLIARR